MGMTSSNFAAALGAVLPRFIVCLVGAVAIPAALATPVKFSIPAQPAPAALQAFMQQSGTQVAYSADDLKHVQANAVAGDYEPAAALGILLQDTGFSATERKAGVFTVVREKAKESATGSIVGSLVWPDGAPASGVDIAIRETGQSAITDRYGRYAFGKVPAGTYLLVAHAEGYQPLHITDVELRANSDLTLGKEAMHKADDVTKLDPYVVHAEAVTELGRFEVNDTKPKAFSDRNVDIPRGIDDVQAYYIFDSASIDRSGATNIEDYLKQQLTMNTVALTNSQASNGLVAPFGNTSTVNLRGLGTDKTLILLDGRRMPTITNGVNDLQPDLNGLPLSAIDRIEVLPSSASGIYGGSVIGGVVNIILKRNYTGGEVRVTYDSAMDTDSPTRTVAATYGMSFPDGKTNLMVTVQGSDAQPLLLQDRREVFERNIARIQANSPNFFSSDSNPWLGALPNIIAKDSALPTLILDDGTRLNSRTTFIAAGTGPTTSPAALAASLLANAGKWNMDLPLSTQSPTGLLQQIGAAPKVRSFTANLRRQMLPKLEMFADVVYFDNRTTLLSNPFTAYQLLPAAAPSNPFKEDVLVRFPNATDLPLNSYSTTRNVTVGAVARLPWEWSAELDYTWSESRFGYDSFNQDGTAVRNDLASGALNPFVDTLRYPVNLAKYTSTFSSSFASTLNDFALRMAGPLKSLPWGTPELTTGLEHRTTETAPGTTENIYPITTTADYRTYFYSREQVTDSAYAETTIPLVKHAWLPGVHALDLQLSGRSERYVVDGGTTNRIDYYGLATPTVTYGGPTRNGQPYFEKARYTSSNFTVGGKYQPVPELTLRASRATAFLPPTPSQLAPASPVSTTFTSVTDPKTGAKASVATIAGGNADVTPQSSKSLNLGLIWEPRWRLLQGLRLDAEYYEIEQSNYISSLSAQQIVNLESVYPNRVIRNAAGKITTVDITNLNLYERKTNGWDLSANYTRRTSVGVFSVQASESIITVLRTQYSQTLPAYDAVGFHPVDGGAPKYKSTVNLVWERRQWTVGWTARYVSDYKVYGAIGSPASLQLGNALYASTRVAQGSDYIPGQIYHDAFVSYAFRKNQSGSAGAAGSEPKRPFLGAIATSVLSGLTVEFGVRNLFDRTAPFDVKYDNNYYLSPYGDVRLRSYWVSLRKAF